MEFIIPETDFKVLFFNSKSGKRFIYAIVLIVIAVLLPIAAIASVGNVYIGLAWILMFILYVSFLWRKMFDIMSIYFELKVSMFLSIISIFVPIVFTVTLIVMAGRKTIKTEIIS